MTDPHSLDARHARMDESDFEFHRARRVRQPGEWLNLRSNKQPFDSEGSNDDAFDAQEARREALALERRDRLWDMPLHEPRVQSHFDDEREWEHRQ